MTLCAHRYLDDPNGTPCTIEEHPEHPGGHVYKGGSGVASQAHEDDGGS